MPRTFLTAHWKNLLMLNYELDPALLQPYLPSGTELDQYEGKTFISLVGFMFEDTRLLGFRFPFHINFEEVNLRFYVKRRSAGEWKRGVVFIKEIVPRQAIRAIANMIYKERYACMPMRHRVLRAEGQLTVSYEWKFHQHWNHMSVTAASQAQPMESGSIEEFIAEHYWGYARSNDTISYEYEVRHVPWRVYPVQNWKVDCAFTDLYGAAFGFLADQQPHSVFLAEGSPVAVLNRSLL